MYHFIQTAVDRRRFHLDALGLDHLLRDEVALSHLLHKVRWLLVLDLMTRRRSAELTRWMSWRGTDMEIILLTRHRVLVCKYGATLGVLSLLSDQALLLWQ